MKRIFHSKFPLAVIFFLWFLFSLPYFLKGLVPFPSTYLVTNFPPWSASYGMPVKNNAMPDVITQIMPWKKVTMDMWKSGHVPLWNPYSFSGTSHAGNYQTAVFTPFGILFFLLPFIDAWSMHILLQPLLAGIFMYLFLRELKCSEASILIGSIGFMFSGFLVTWMAYGTLGYAILFLPLIVWSIHRYMYSNSVFAFPIGIFGVACSFLSGHFQISLYVVFVAAAYCFYHMIAEKQRKTGIIGILMIMLGIGIASPQVFLTYHVFQESVREAYTKMQEVIPWNYIVTFLSPDFYGNPITRNNWYGHYAEWGGYVGIVVLMLALYAVIFSKHKEKWFFLILIFFSFLFAYTSPFSTLLFTMKIPVLSTSAASRIIVLTSFSLCILAAFGFEQLFLDWKKGLWKKWAVVVSVFLSLLAIVWGVLIIGKPFTADWLIVAKRNMMLPTIFILISGVVAGVGFIRKIAFRHLAVVVLLALCCFDAYRFSSKWMPFDPKEYVYPSVKVLSFLQKEIGIHRVFGNLGGEVGSMFSIPLIEGYDAMYQSRYGEFIGSVSNGIVSEPERSVVRFDKHGKYSLPALQILGVKYIVHRLSDGRNIWAFPFWQYSDDFKSIYKDEHYEVLEYVNTYPRVFLASSYVTEKDKQKIIDALFEKDFNRRTTLVLEENPKIDPQEGEGSAEFVLYSPTKIIVKTSSPVPKLLFLSDVYDSGWKVIIDGKEDKILRADYDFRALPLPEGEHTVEYRYAPKSLQNGIIVMGVAFICTVACIILIVKKRI